MKVSIIILNRNGRKDTIECLESVFRNTYDNYEVMLVDNHSTNESLDKIRSWVNKEIEVESKYFDTTVCTHDLTLFEYSKAELDDGSYLEGKSKIDALASDKKLFLLKNDDNYGFAEGNNIAMRQVIAEGTSEYILLLNNDTVVDKDFLIELVNNGKVKKDLGMIAPVNYNYYDGSVDFRGGKINRRLGRPYHIKEKNTLDSYEFLTGCCLLIPIDIVKETKGFDPIYFCYFEDADLSQRIIKNGKKLYVSGGSSIYHKISATSNKKSIFYISTLAKNRIIFTLRYSKSLYILPFLFYHIFIKSIGSFIFFNKNQRKAWFDGIKNGIQ